MHTDVLIIGQGICGTMLSWFLQKAGISYVVIDDNQVDTPSKIAAGIINPVTGRRFVYSWMIDTIMPFAVKTYEEIGFFLDKKLIAKKDIIDFFPSAQMRDGFVTRLTENDTFLHTYPDQNHFNQYFNYNYGCGKISPSYTAYLHTLLYYWRMYLKEKDFLIEDTFEEKYLSVNSAEVKYKDITADKIIFCNGLEAMNYDWFKKLPFSPSKGEALIIESSELTNEHIFKKGYMLAPLAEKNTFWVGSSYQWEFEHVHPSSEFLAATTQHLNNWLKVSYKVVDHKAALRPSTLERRPFVGFHPYYSNIGILNGMGTKGVSLAPYFAHQLTQQYVAGEPIIKEANVERFNKILAK